MCSDAQPGIGELLIAGYNFVNSLGCQDQYL